MPQFIGSSGGFLPPYLVGELHPALLPVADSLTQFCHHHQLQLHYMYNNGDNHLFTTVCLLKWYLTP